ncbi:hypothetical protein Tco_1190305, partial [Tanacetum coccineum]
MGTFLLNNRYASILFDTGADRSFVSTTFSSLAALVYPRVPPEGMTMDVDLVHPRVPPEGMTMDVLPADAIGLYAHHFQQGGLRVPFSSFLLK